MEFDDIRNHIEEAGFIYLGGFHPQSESFSSQTLILIGNAGPGMWQKFSTSPEIKTSSLDGWTKRTVTPLADTLGANALFPFDTPAHPFLRWAAKSGETFPSPIGLSIHPRYGLWHGYRAALVFYSMIKLPPAPQKKSPCDSCREKPCLTTCPVQAFTPQGYNVPACVDHIKTTDKPDCLEKGCRARRMCPIGQDFRYSPRQAKFHMTSFVKANG